MSVYVVNNYYADETNISWDGGDPHSNTLQYDGTLEFTGTTEVVSEGGNKRNVTFDAPEIIMKSQIWIYNDDNNSITYRDALVNFDEATWNATFVGRIFFTGTSSLNITANSKGKTLIHASTLSGTITLDVEDGVQDGDTFLIEATDNQLVITDGEWTATPSTVGNITTYTLAKSAPVYKTRLIYEHLTDIPLNFTEVEYLEADGTQYIDTGVKATNKTKAIVKSVGMTWVFGGRTSLSYGDAFGVCLGQNAAYLQFGNQSITYSKTNIKNDIVLLENSQDGCYVNGVKQASYNTQTFTGTNNIYLFNLNDNNSLNDGLIGKIWFSKIYEDGVLVRDFVPCLDNNNTPCLYDKIEGKAYYNAGTGSFTYGRKIIPVEYIESTGTQWVDTGLTKGDSTFTSINDMAVISASSTDRQAFAGADWDVSSHMTYNPQTKKFDVQNVYSVDCVITLGTRYIVEGVFGSSNVVMTLKDQNGTQLGTVTRPTMSWTSSNTYTWLIGSIHNKQGNTNLTLKFYGSKIYQGNILKRDFIPCKDENNVGYMFDRVTHTVYLNAGTGSFAFGKVMPKKKLRLIMDSKRRVPKGFKEVEYLESTGTQYIDTGYIPNINTECSMNLAFVSLDSTYRTPFSVRTVDGATNSFTIMSVRATNDNNSFAFGSNYWSGSSIPSVVLNKTVKAVLRKGYAYWDGVIGNPGNSITPTTLTAYMFARNSNGTAGNFFMGKIYKCTIKDGDTLVRDFIPCLDSNNVPCMWDAVERKAYYNAGTGSFSYGHMITPVEYLQSSGTQYIDTGYIASNTSGFSVKIMPLQSTDKYFIGSRPRTDTNDRWLAGSNVGPQVYIGWNTNNFVNWELNKVHTVQNNFMNSRTKVLDGTVVAQISETLSSQGSRTAYLFSANDANATALDTCRIYGTQISDGSSLVRDFIPVKDENNVGYMFDKVSHTLYYNAGTGAFVVGGEYKDIVRFLKGE